MWCWAWNTPQVCYWHLFWPATFLISSRTARRRPERCQEDREDRGDSEADLPRVRLPGPHGRVEQERREGKTIPVNTTQWIFDPWPSVLRQFYTLRVSAQSWCFVYNFWHVPPAVGLILQLLPNWQTEIFKENITKHHDWADAPKCKKSGLKSDLHSIWLWNGIPDLTNHGAFRLTSRGSGTRRPSGTSRSRTPTRTTPASSSARASTASAPTLSGSSSSSSVSPLNIRTGGHFRD